MDTIAASFANLVKTNNGMFKSPMQAGYLLSLCRDGEYVTTGSVGRAGYTIFYTCDDKGVVKVQKQTVAKGMTTEWERRENGKLSVQDDKEIKRIKRMIKQTEKSVAERAASRAAGKYPNDALYAEAQKRDQESLTTLNQMLAKLTK